MSSKKSRSPAIAGNVSPRPSAGLMGEIQEYLRRSSRKPAQREAEEGDLERSFVEFTRSSRKEEGDSHSSTSSISSVDEGARQGDKEIVACEANEDSSRNEGRDRISVDVEAFEDAIRREFVTGGQTPLTDHLTLQRGIAGGVVDLDLGEELEEDEAHSILEYRESSRWRGLAFSNSNVDPDYLRESCSDALDDTRRLRRRGTIRSDFHLRPARPPKPRWKDCCRLKFGI